MARPRADAGPSRHHPHRRPAAGLSLRGRRRTAPGRHRVSRSRTQPFSRHADGGLRATMGGGQPLDGGDRPAPVFSRDCRAHIHRTGIDDLRTTRHRGRQRRTRQPARRRRARPGGGRLVSGKRRRTRTRRRPAAAETLGRRRRVGFDRGGAGPPRQLRLEAAGNGAIHRGRSARRARYVEPRPRAAARLGAGRRIAAHATSRG